MRVAGTSWFAAHTTHGNLDTELRITAREDDTTVYVTPGPNGSAGKTYQLSSVGTTKTLDGYGSLSYPRDLDRAIGPGDGANPLSTQTREPAPGCGVPRTGCGSTVGARRHQALCHGVDQAV